MKTCPQCGNNTNDDSKFCTVCGASFPDPLIEEKKKELKYHEKRMDRGGAIIAAGCAFFVPVIILVLTSSYTGRPLFLFDILLWGIPGVILVIIGFVIFGDSFSESKRIKEEYPILFIPEDKIKKH